MIDIFYHRFLCTLPFTTLVSTATVAPRIELFTELVCRDHKPDYSVGKETPIPQFHNPQSFGISNGVMVQYPYSSSIIDSLPRSLYDSTYAHVPVLTFAPLKNSSYSSRDGEIGKGSDGDDEKVDPSLCFTDPDVQSAVAEFIVCEYCAS